MNSFAPATHISPRRSHFLLKAVIHVIKTWLQHIPVDDPRRGGVLSTLLFVEPLLATGDISPNSMTRAVSMFCASCTEIHPDLAAGCTSRELKNCWLLGLLAGARQS